MTAGLPGAPDPVPGGLPGRRAQPGLWLAAAGLALAVHLGIVAAFWDSPVLPQPGGDGDGLRISLAPLGRGAPVSLAPAPDIAPGPEDLPAADSLDLKSTNGRTDGEAAPLPEAVVEPTGRPGPSPAQAVDAIADPGPDPAPEPASDAASGPSPAGAGSGAGPPPAPRPRPAHLVRADPGLAAQASPRPLPGRRPGLTEPARSPISGLPLAGRTAGSGATGGDPAGQAAGTPDPRATGGAAPDTAGTAGAGTLLEGYLLRLQGIMQRNRRYPEAALSQRQQGVVILGFSLDRSGRLLGGRVVRSSGHDLLDREALDLLQRVAPLPPFPPGVGAERLDLEVPIRFDRPGVSGR